MARNSAITSGPIELMDTATGKQLSLPLTDVFFEDNQVKAQGALYTANKTLFDGYLGHLVKTGLLVSGSPPAANPALVIKAKTAGAAGNFIQVEIKNLDSSVPPKFDASVSETDTYNNLKPDTVQKVLAEQPGLVLIPGVAPAATAVPKAGTYPLAIAGAATAATADIPLHAGAGNAFKVQAKADGAEGERTTVEIKDVDAVKSTFTLVATWKKSAASKIAATELGTTFSYEIEVSAPAGSASVGTPLPGTITLSGGSDAKLAAAASAVASG